MQQQSSASRFVPVRAISQSLGERCFGFPQLARRRLLDDPTVQVRAPVANLYRLDLPRPVPTERIPGKARSIRSSWLPEELRVLLSLPVVSRHGDRDRFRALDNRKCPEAYAESHPVQASLLTSVFITPAYGPGTPFGEIKVSRRTGMFRRGTRTLRVGAWRHYFLVKARGIRRRGGARPTFSGNLDGVVHWLGSQLRI